MKFKIHSSLTYIHPSFIMPRIIPRTIPVTGYKHFLTPLRRLIFDYDPLSPSQHGVRAYLRKPLLSMAEANPDVEVLVRKLRRGKAAVLRGHYGERYRIYRICSMDRSDNIVNGRDKVICVNKMEANEVEKKVSCGVTAV
jgi:large subunit ribosomal protein L43